MKQVRNILIFLQITVCFVGASQALADDKPALETIDDFAPPAITNEDLTKPEVTVVEKNGDVVEEYRVNGELYMMKVTPKHGKPYTLHKADAEGGWQVLGPNEPLSVPKWTLFTF